MILRVGDIVHRLDNGGWWWMQRVHEKYAFLVGRCIRNSFKEDFEIGHTSNFSTPSVSHYLVRVDPDEVPDELWAVIAKLALLGEGL